MRYVWTTKHSLGISAFLSQHGVQLHLFLDKRFGEGTPPHPPLLASCWAGIRCFLKCWTTFSFIMHSDLCDRAVIRTRSTIKKPDLWCSFLSNPSLGFLQQCWSTATFLLGGFLEVNCFGEPSSLPAFISELTVERWQTRRGTIQGPYLTSRSPGRPFEKCKSTQRRILWLKAQGEVSAILTVPPLMSGFTLVSQQSSLVFQTNMTVALENMKPQVNLYCPTLLC